MSAYLLCLSINGGIPLFTRKNGDLKVTTNDTTVLFDSECVDRVIKQCLFDFNSLQSIPFPLLASLNGVAMFGASHDVTLLR